MRLFAALPLSEEVIEEIAVWWTAAGLYLPAVQWREIPSERWHLTLAFFGEVDGRDYNQLAMALEECATRYGPMQLGLSGYGVFPNARRPRVFWIGTTQYGGNCTLGNLAGCCRRAGHANVRKRTEKSSPFRGHITLARCRGVPEALKLEGFREMPEVPAISWTVGRLELIRSTLQRDGARYQILEEFPLGVGCIRGRKYPVSGKRD